MLTQNHSDSDLYIGPSPWRLGLAFCMFLGLVGVGGWGLSNFLLKPDQPLLTLDQSATGKTHIETTSAGGGEPLFYRVVGNAGVVEGSPFEHESSLEQELQSLNAAKDAPKPESPELSSQIRGKLPVAAKAPTYTIELKKTTDRHEAEDLVSALQSKGIQAFYTPMLSDNFVTYRVRVGIYTSKAVAQKDLAAINPHVSHPGQISELH